MSAPTRPERAQSERRGARRRACQHCGLPVVVSAAPGDAGSPEPPVFCCYGCDLAQQITQGGDGSAGSGLASGIFTRLMLAVFLSMAVMIFSVALYSDAWFPATGSTSGEGGVPGGAARPHALGPLAPLFGWIACGFATPVLFLLGWPLLWHDVKQRRGSIGPVHLLILVGVVAAYVLSVVQLLRGSVTVYFETAVMVLVLVTLGRFLDARARQRVTRELRGIVGLDPETSRVLDTTDSEGRFVPTAELRAGQHVRVLAGERVPADGVVRSGRASVDVSALTGESRGRTTESGHEVWAGTLALDGAIDVEVRAAPGSRVLDRMVETVDTALAERMPLERLAERVSRWFLPFAVLAALTTAVLTTWHVGAEEGVLRALAVLLIACPCALGIATPLAAWVAVGRAARRGILVRGAEVLETLTRVDRVYLDKTGTLTSPRLEPLALELVSHDSRPEFNERRVLELARSLTSRSRHPVAECVTRWAESMDALALPVLSFESSAGLGLAARVRDEDGRSRHVLAGSRRWLEQHQVEDLDALEGRDATALWLAVDGRLLARFSLDESLRSGARELVTSLRRRGLEPVVLTGDSRERAARWSRELGIPVEAELLPTDKVARIRQDQEHGHVALVVGDGLNDAPVLAAADVSVALSCGAELSREVAGAVLLELDGAGLERLDSLFEIARSTVRRVRFNLFWAFAWNSCGIALAAFGAIHPLAAAILMVGSSLFVVAGSVVGWEDEDAGAALARPAGKANEVASELANGVADLPDALATSTVSPPGGSAH